MTQKLPSLPTAAFEYECPQELIAQHPCPDRTASRLLHLGRASGAVLHKQFTDFIELLDPGDALVINTSRVINARLHGVRQNGAPAEVLLVHPDTDDTWIAMVHPGGKLKIGRTVRFDDVAELEVTGVIGGGLRQVRLTGLDWQELMDRYGALPLPPYIERSPEREDQDRYQTVYAREDGSIAAPTAGLHFTDDFLDRVERHGVHVVNIVLHVGPGTFKPVGVDDPTEHTMHAEWYSVPQETAETVTATRNAGRRVWAVGTTVARVLETVGQDGTMRPQTGWTKLFIYPPYDFHIVDGLITNFHLPRSTLLMLVAAFAGVDAVLAAYRSAVAERYRLYSYGDAMVVV